MVKMSRNAAQTKALQEMGRAQTLKNRQMTQVLQNIPSVDIEPAANHIEIIDQILDW